MHNYKKDLLYPKHILTPEEISRAMAHGRKLRSEAFQKLLTEFYTWLTSPRRTFVDSKSFKNGATDTTPNIAVVNGLRF